MSFRIQPTPPARPNRCQLFGPGSNTKLFAKMAASDADVINLDLEDSVSPNDKDAARANVIGAINDVDWNTKHLSVRINSLDTRFWYRDVVDLLEQAGDRLDQIMIPKVGCAADVYAVDAASMGMQTTGIGGTQDNYYMLHGDTRHYSDPWHWAQTAIVAACRTHGILPVDGPFGDFSDDEGYRAQARRSATLGMVGKWAIHPKQIALANEVFTPSAEAIAEAREILAAMEDANARGEGATVYKGRLVDIASIKQAGVIVKQSEMIAG
jgi:malyl-CoA/(S)-citramalyl-CoA lyase